MGLRLTLLGLTTLVILAVMLSLHGAGKAAPTYDEPLHLAASYVARHELDLRANPEHPPLWKWLIGLTLDQSALPQARTDTPLYQRLAEIPRAQWQWAATVLYRTGGGGKGQDLDELFARARGVTLGWGVALLLMTAWAGWRMGNQGEETGRKWGRGKWVALLAVAMLALDPTFLGHSSLVTNDVPFAVVTLGFVTTLVRLWERVTVGRVVAVGGVAGVGMLVKFAAVVFVPMLAVVLAIRVVAGGEWVTAWGAVRSRLSRAGMAISAGALAVGVGAAVVVGVYALFSPAGRSLPAEPELEEIRKFHGGELPISARMLAGVHGSVPVLRPMTRGLLTQLRISQTSRGFVLGENRNPAPWYALPLAYGLKTPVGLLGLLVFAAALGIWGRWGGEVTHGGKEGWVWVTALALGVLVLMAVVSGRARGVRYLLPVLPVIYLLAANGITRVAMAGRGKWLGWIAGLMLLVAGAETASAGGRHIAFFNLPSRTLGPPYELLGDSNLDWGQGLLELAGWQQANPQATPLYLAYFGNADPRSYGLKYISSPGGYFMDPTTARPQPGSYLAISATILQGTYLSPALAEEYAILRRRTPYAVLGGGSILVFRIEEATEGGAAGPP